MSLPLITHWPQAPASRAPPRRTADVTNPATGQVTGQVAFAGVEDADAVIAAAAAAASRAWARHLARRAHPGPVRVPRAAQRAASDELAAMITAEHGKVLSDALGEVSRGLEVVEFACGIPHLLKGGYTESVSTGVDVHSKRQPLGRRRHHQPVQLPGHGADVVLPVAIAAGNAVVLKPSEKDPSASIWMAELWARGRPARRRLQRAAGRQGGGRRAARAPRRQVDQLRRLHPDRAATSTRPRRAHGKRVQALGGAKNHMVVLPDADLDLAADQAVNAGFGSAGERCMAISRARRGRPGRRRPRRQDRRPHPRARAPATAPVAPTWARWSPRPTATRSRRTSRRARRPAPRSSSTAARWRPTARATASGSARRCSTTSPPRCRVYTDEIFGPVLSRRPRRDLRRGARAGQRQPVRQRRRASSPTTAARRAGSSTTSRSA